MNSTPELTAKARFAISIGWLLLLPIGLLWSKYFTSLANGSYGDSPGKAAFTFGPIVFLIGFSFLLYLIACKEAPRRSKERLFFWIACAPIAAELFFVLLG